MLLKYIGQYYIATYESYLPCNRVTINGDQVKVPVTDAQAQDTRDKEMAELWAWRDAALD